MRNKVNHIHFSGIGGVGMSAIAEVLYNLGYKVSGSDISQNHITERLLGLGIMVANNHDAINVGNADVIVRSSAIDDNNPEVIFGLNNNIPVIPRAMMLAELMRFKYGIAIAGTHGKTTTTSMTAEVLSVCGLDPTFIIGGKLATTNSNSSLGGGDYLVAEADESDASFLYLNPMIAVITNIDLDHMETYNYDEEILKQTFIDFLHRMPFYGRAILCFDDMRVRQIIPMVKRPITTYGLSDAADIYATGIQALGNAMYFDLHIKSHNLVYPIQVNMPGIHNVLNSLAVIAVSLECGCNIADVALGLKGFHGVGRRCEHYPEINYQNKNALLVDDYGHHPVEIAATLNALRGAHPNRRIVLIFQPHRYSRTKALFDDFIRVLSGVEQLIISEVYSAGEQPIENANSQSLVAALRDIGNLNVNFVEDLEQAKDKLFDVLCDNDLVVTMGAGSIAKLPTMLLA